MRMFEGRNLPAFQPKLDIVLVNELLCLSFCRLIVRAEQVDAQSDVTVRIEDIGPILQIRHHVPPKKQWMSAISVTRVPPCEHWRERLGENNWCGRCPI